ncbi:primosomal replication protein [Shewanella corallii]|uniref:Primosomal replication protein n=2 Tax=Shewanella TaxID=22 RepID=A0ABT0NDE6_9GAMM|nr:MULTISPECIES: primosomal replication protein [Shewanella]MCL1036679.1 primosomal replication protein [Shewanella submarina]MCL2915802.1 primosomal replication protein [Shewanella corallii]
MKHQDLIRRLRTQLRSLEQEVLRHDQNLPEKDSKLLKDVERFNHELFHQTGGRLGPCIPQLGKLIGNLEKQLQLGLSADLIRLSCERIQDRFAALKRALATTDVNIKDANQTRDSKRARYMKQQANRHQTSGFDWIASSVMQNSHQLYDELNKHLNWAKRIEQKIAQLNMALDNCPNTDKINLQHEILAMHRRLGKCRQAISYIEDRIQLLERPFKDYNR